MINSLFVWFFDWFLILPKARFFLKKMDFWVCYKRCSKWIEKCLGPYTLEHTRPRLAHGSQASDGLVSTGEGDHSGILNVLGLFFFTFYFFFKKISFLISTSFIYLQSKIKFSFSLLVHLFFSFFIFSFFCNSSFFCSIYYVNSSKNTYKYQWWKGIQKKKQKKELLERSTTTTRTRTRSKFKLEWDSFHKLKTIQLYFLFFLSILIFKYFESFFFFFSLF